MCKGTLLDGSPCRMVARTPDGLCVICAMAVHPHRRTVTPGPESAPPAG
jgi:hypothetical protein